MARARRGVDLFDVCVLAVLAGLSMWVVALDLWQAARHGLVWTGIDGELPVDQMQYLAWVQDASRHLLVSDLFGLRATPHDYLQPMVAVSGGLTALGMAPWLALLVWKPVGVGAIFFAVRTYCRRVLATRAQQRAALLLGLFAASFGTLGDEWIPFSSWGYPFALVALAIMVGALLAYDRARREGRCMWLAPALGLLASWLHPWQGELLIQIVAGGELVARGCSLRRARGPSLRRGRGPSLRHGFTRSIGLPASTVAAAMAPLLYYAILDRADEAWRLADAVTKHHLWSLEGALLPLAALLLAASLAYRRRPQGFLASATRVWPLAALTVWALSKNGLGATPLHAWAGITIPLAALAVEGAQSTGLRRLPARRWLAVILLAALTIPGTVQLMSAANGYIAPATHNQNLIKPDEQQAFRYLAGNPEPGAVLSSYTLGDAVPGETGRRVFAGDFRWSGPGYELHERTTSKLLDGSITGSPARRFVLATGARFVLADCTSHADLTQTLAPIPLTVHRFGCATVYQIR